MALSDEGRLRGWRAQLGYIDAAHRVHARVEDCIRTGKDCGIGRFPSHDFAMNSAWLAVSLIAAVLLSWLRLIALDGDLAKAEPKTLRYRGTALWGFNSVLWGFNSVARVIWAGLPGCGCGAGTGEQQREAVTVLP